MMSIVLKFGATTTAVVLLDILLFFFFFTLNLREKSPGEFLEISMKICAAAPKAPLKFYKRA